MSLKFRLLCYLVVALLIPTLIWLVYGEIPMDSLYWIGFCLVIVIGYEVINKLRRK